MVLYPSLNRYHAILASEASGRKVMHFHAKLDRYQANLASEASGWKRIFSIQILGYNSKLII